jgi:ATPase subunit of ABC transporter with duplicated ATPase domains
MYASRRKGGPVRARTHPHAAHARTQAGISITSATTRHKTPKHRRNPIRRRPQIWKKKYIKVLIVGDSGLGKTTLIKTLLSTPGERLTVHDGTFTPAAQFVKDPESLCSTVTWKDEEDRVIWVYRIQVGCVNLVVWGVLMGGG